MKDISTSFLNKLQARNRKIDLKTWIDWNADNTEDQDEIITSDIDSLTVDKKLEGNIGTSVVDKATITVNNSTGDYSPKNMSGKWANNVLPTRQAKIWAGVDGDLLNIFNGRLEAIKPNRYNTGITIKDDIYVLQNKKCPDRFYYDYSAEDIIKEWLDDTEISYTEDSIDTTNTSINYNFKGKSIWQGILYIAESVWAKAYLEDEIFYFKTKMSLGYEEEEPVYVFSTYGQNDNIWQITEELSSTNIYNEVQINSSPYLPQPKQIIWTGSEEESEVTEEYNSNEIENNELQLTHVPKGSTTEEPTENVPILNNSLGILDITSGIEYTVQDDAISVDNDTGLITFQDTEEFPTPEAGHQLRIKYQYHFNRIVPGSIRDFYIELDNPAIDIEDLIIIARDDEGEELVVSFSDRNADIYVQQIFPNDPAKYGNDRVRIIIENNSSLTARLYGVANEKEVPTMLLRGVPFIQTEQYQIVEADQDSIDAYKIRNNLTIENDLFNSENKLKQTAQYLLYEYSTPKSRLKVTTKGVPHLEMMDKVTIEQIGRQIDINFIIKGIKHKLTNKGSWDIELDLEQAQPSAWEYEEDGTPVLVGKRQYSKFDITPPAKVEGFNLFIDGALRTGMSRVVLSWDHNKEIDLFEYYIYRKESNQSEDEWKNIGSVKKGTTTFIDSTIKFNGEYDYYITAVDQNNNESEKSEILSIVVEDLNPPSKPIIIDVYNTIRGVIVMLEESNEDDWDGFKIYISKEEGFTPDDETNLVDKGRKRRFEITSLEPGETYYVKAVAYDFNRNNSEVSDQFTKLTKGENTSSTITIAANNSSRRGKAGADFVCDKNKDQVQINDAIDNLNNGGRVILLEGTYEVDDSIKIKSEITLQGQGRSTKIVAADNINDDFGIISNSNNTESITIEKINIDGNKDNNGVNQNIRGIYLNDVKDADIKDCKVSNCNDNGIEIVDGDVELINTKVINNDLNGLDARSALVRISGCVFSGNSRHGIYFFQTSGSIIDNRTIQNGLAGIMLNGITDNIIVSENYIAENKRQGILVREISDDGKINGNDFRNNSQSGDEEYAQIELGAPQGSIETIQRYIIENNTFRSSGNKKPDGCIYLNAGEVMGAINYTFIKGNDFYNGAANYAIKETSDVIETNIMGGNRGLNGNEITQPDG